jgi:PIN like domain
MAARRSKSKKPSAGSAPSLSPSPPDDFVLYLDENLCNSRAILDTLTKLGVRSERHLDHFGRGIPDETWLPLVGSKGWVLLTADKRIRYNFLEKHALEEHAVREFVFTSGNMSGQDMAAGLKLALPKMRRLCHKLNPPFVASITRLGEVHLRWPKG